MKFQKEIQICLASNLICKKTNSAFNKLSRVLLGLNCCFKSSTFRFEYLFSIQTFLFAFAIRACICL